MTPHQFIEKWRASELKERSASQEHFIDLCRLLDEPTPAEADPTGETYCFERGARKDTGGDGWADVWKRHHFAWEYKGQRADLNSAFGQLRQYALALENPPLLIVSDMVRFRIRTNWTNSVSRLHEFDLDDLADAATRNKLKWAFSDPERLRPGETRQTLTERVASSFAAVARALRERGHDPQTVAHFVNRLVFCMFADDVGLLPNQMFTRMLRESLKTPAAFGELAGELFRAMASGGRVGFETVDRFNGNLFNDDTTLPLEKSDIQTVLEASDLDWSEIDPSILGTLFERGLDPAKRAQLGAHYTDRDKVMLLVDPVVVRPLLAEWDAEKTAIVVARDDDTTFGILHSRFHELWSLRRGTWLGKGNDPRYTPTTIFETFPFPAGLTPNVPAASYAAEPQAIAVAEAAKRLVDLRDRWLNPPEWVDWVDEPVPGYPKRPVPRDEDAAKTLKKRTLTNLYNTRPQWLADAHGP